ncbi:MAG TPA: hypothetical protein VNS55_09830 [Nocardioides sp.]|nr:hypothetical protein [Nocardioides sp.]
MGRRSAVVVAWLAAVLLAACMAGAPGSARTTPGAADPTSNGTSTAPATAPTYGGPHPRVYLDTANTARLQDLLAASDPAAVRFRQMVDGALGPDGEDVYDYQAWFSALLGALTGKDRYCSDAVRRVRHQVAAEERRIAAGKVPRIAGDSYLEVGPRVAEIALTIDWCHAAVSASRRKDWTAFANQAVWNVWHHARARWGDTKAPWTGWSVDNPSNNYYYSFLEATELLGLATFGENAKADQWLDRFRNQKIQDQLVPTFDAQLQGGGSREGTGYGNAMRTLWWLYDVWEASTGERIADLTTHTRLSMAYLVHETVPTLDRIAPIGDHPRDSTASLFDYHREYGLALAQLYPDDELTGPLRTWLASISVPQMTQPFEYVWDFLYGGGPTTTAPLADLRTTYFAPGTGHLFARSGWDTHATWLELAMGAHTESHAHQDQLSFLLYDDDWLAYDPNIDSSSGLRQEASAHNLVEVTEGGTELQQYDGSATVEAFADNDTFTYAAADATALYADPYGGHPVDLAQREVVWLKPGVLVVYDRVSAEAGTAYHWLLHAPSQPTVNGPTATFDGGRLVDRSIAPSGAVASVKDLTQVDPDYRGGYRLAWTVPGGDQVGFLHVLSVDGAVTSATDAAQGTQDGVTIQLASGGTATVRFERDAVGGTLTLTGGGGSYDDPLPTGVQTLPLLAP